MNLVLAKGDKVHKISIVHWWPERMYKSNDTMHLNRSLEMLVYEARRDGSKYATCATCDVGYAEFVGTSRCMKIDKPTRRFGLDRAVGLLKQQAVTYGWQVLEADKDWKPIHG